MARERFTHRPSWADGRGQSGDEPSPRTPTVVAGGSLSLVANLREGDPYKIVLWATVKDGIASQALDAVEDLVERIAEALRQCEGLELPEEPLVVREGDFSLAHLRRFLRLDDWDDLSRG